MNLSHNYDAVKSKAGGLALLGILLIVVAVILPFSLDSAAAFAVCAVVGSLGGALVMGGIIASVVAAAIKPEEQAAPVAYQQPTA